MKELETMVRRAFPKLDIRSDQCELIRIITPNVTVGLRRVKDIFEATVISLEGDLDFETNVIATLRSDCATDLISRLKAHLE